MKLENNRPKRRSVLLFSLLVLALPIVNMSCKRTADKRANGNAANANSSVAADSTSSTPPFPTKEPERYQATWVTSGVVGGQSIPGLEALIGFTWILSGRTATMIPVYGCGVASNASTFP